MSSYQGSEKRADELYHEEIRSFWGWLAISVFFLSAGLFIVLFFIQRTSGPIGSDPEPDWYYLLMPVFFTIVGLLMTNFTKLTISANPQGITAAFGRFRHFEPWDNIASVERDETSAMRSYGGYGIRFGWRQGEAVLMYNTMGAPALLLKLKRGKRRYFGFSTKHPDEVIAVINTQKK